MAPHITTDKAYEIDLDWQNTDADDADMLPRLVYYRNVTLLTIPSLNGSAPTYQYRRHDPETGAYAPAYYHTAGPTLAEWQFEQACREQQGAIEAAGGMSAYHSAARDAAELASVLEAEYRDEMDTRRSACAWAVQ